MIPAQETIAGSLGYISIACWLCAQLPQVVKNVSLQSCEGLSLPFLINWLFGDLTNLIGCVLTDQLPFQTYLATYFCIIDFTLCIQYFYYLRPPTPAKPHTHHHHVHYASIPATAITSPQTSPFTSPGDSPIQFLDHRSHSHSHGQGSSSSSATVQPRNKRKHSHGPPSHAHIHGGHGHGYRSQSTSQLFGADLGNLGMTSPLPPNATDSYLDLYAAALDVARAAERVSSRRSESRKARLSRQTTSNTMSHLDEGDGDGDGNGGGMMDSFHSDLSAQSRTSSNHDIEERRKMSSSTQTLDRGRGRNMRRDLVLTSPMPPSRTLEGEDEDRLDALPNTGTGVEGVERPGMGRSKSRSLSVVRTQSGKGKGRRAAGVAFMSLGLIARFGGIAPRIEGNDVGRVLGRNLEMERTTIRHPNPFLYGPGVPFETSNYYTTIELPEGTYKAHEHGHEDPGPESPSFKRLFGRTSAWACTTLYLTSRLPQIWKNFMRKSVEGLSIFLFFFAFCGNLTYVASILLNPAGSASPSDAGHYLLEALPYLLGSGGTLLFDMTIMIQSCMYGSAPPLPDVAGSITRRKNRRKRTTTAEDGYTHTHTNGGKEERQPLLPPPSLVRYRSDSPEHTKRNEVHG